MSNNKTIQKIDKYLTKKSHINYFSILLKSYNQNDLYIRFDYVNKIKAYKIIWFDLQYLDTNHLEYFESSQLVTSYLANKMVDYLINLKLETASYIDSNILNDRVEIYNKIDDKKGTRKYTFDRFLPLEWKELINPLSLIFTYLPRSMELILNEMFAKYDKQVEYYNSRKPIKINISNGEYDHLFRKDIISIGKKLVKRVEFLEEIDNKYIAVIDDRILILVVIEKVTNDFYHFYSSTNKPYLDEFIYATITAIQKKEFKNFYKVKYKDKRARNLLDEVRKGEYFCCCGIEEDGMLLVSLDRGIIKVPYLENGKLVFEVIEDDDNLSLSKIIEKYK